MIPETKKRIVNVTCDFSRSLLFERMTHRADPHEVQQRFRTGNEENGLEKTEDAAYDKGRRSRGDTPFLHNRGGFG